MIQINYEAVILQMHDTRKALAADFNSLETNIRKKANQRTLSERNRNQVTEQIETAHAALLNARNEFNIVEATYSEERQELDESMLTARSTF